MVIRLKVDEYEIHTIDGMQSLETADGQEERAVAAPTKKQCRNNFLVLGMLAGSVVGLLIWLLSRAPSPELDDTQGTFSGMVGRNPLPSLVGGTQNLNSLQAMCNNPLVTGSEGSVVEKAELQAVVIATRHGDRTPYNSGMKGFPKIRCIGPIYSNGKSSSDLMSSDEYARIHVVKPKDGDQSEAKAPKDGYLSFFTTGGRLPNHLLPAHDELGNCIYSGELTPWGVEQMSELGKQLHSAYSALLEKIPPSQITVLSTNVHRTINSAAAFLSEFLPSKFLHDKENGIPNPPINIFVETDKDKDIFHSRNKCNKASKLMEKQSKHSGTVFSLRVADLKKKVETGRMIWRDWMKNVHRFADPMQVHYCHRQELGELPIEMAARRIMEG